MAPESPPIMLSGPNIVPQGPQELVILAGVVGSGKSSLSEKWSQTLPEWKRVNQDDLGDRRTCENAVRSHLRQGHSVVVDRQNFDAAQRQTWLEIATEFPGVKVGGMVMGTSKDECRSRLLNRQNHPTIGTPELAVQLLDKFTDLWEAPCLDEGFDQLITLPPLPLPSDIDAALIQSLLERLHASPLNASAPQQRTPRPREPYLRPDGFVDDGTCRPPLPTQSNWGGHGGHAFDRQNAYGGVAYQGAGRAGGGYGYRPQGFSQPSPHHQAPFSGPSPSWSSWTPTQQHQQQQRTYSSNGHAPIQSQQQQTWGTGQRDAKGGNAGHTW
ncbi:hypothetical protein JCM11641_002495 [Rhodosporidiobolus odoratus]